MGEAWFHFHGSLEDFLPAASRGSALRYAFLGAPAVKDGIEALGVPHPEVGGVVVDGRAVELAERLSSGARVEVYPMAGPVDAPARFAADVHLGRLAAYLRMLGFDVTWSRGATDPGLARLSSEEGRVLLTRDVGLLKRGEVRHGYFPRQTAPRAQLQEVVRRFGLASRAAPFTRCLRCNALLEEVAKEEIAERLPPRVRREQVRFRRCPGCGRIYWAGSHHARMEELIASLAAK